MSDSTSVAATPPEEAAPARRRWRVDPWGLLVALAAVGIFLAQGFQGGLSRDLAIYAYAGERVADGVAPYVGILNRAGPLAHLVPGAGAWGARLVGADELMGMRVVMMVLSVVCVWATYMWARDVLGSRLAGLASATALLTFEGFVTYATGGPREKTIMMLFSVLALWSMSKRRWGLAGGCVALATLAWQPAFFPAVLAALVAMIALRSIRAAARAVIAFAVGGLIPTAVCVAYFWMAGALQAFLDGFVLINAQYTAQAGMATYFGYGFKALESGYGSSLWVIGAGLLASLVFGVAKVPRALRDGDPAAAATVANAVATLGGIAWSLRAFNGWPDAMVLLPTAAFGIGAVAQFALDKAPRRLGVTMVAGGTALLLAGAVAGSLATRNDKLERQRDAVLEILAAGPDNPTIMSFGAAQPLVLTDRTNPSRLQNFQQGLASYVDDTYPGGLAGFADFVAQEQPTYLTFDKLAAYPFLAAVVERDYARVGTTVGWTWYVSREVGPDVIDHLRDAKKLVNDSADASAASTVNRAL